AGSGHEHVANPALLQSNGRATNLHSLGDSGMFPAQQLDDGQYLQRLLALPAPADIRPLQLHDSAQWAEQSCRIATRDGLYPTRRKVYERYAATWRPVAEAQVRLAGERLAALLNALLEGH